MRLPSVFWRRRRSLALLAALLGAGRLPVAAVVRQLPRRHHAVPGRGRAGQRHHERAGGADQARHEPGPGARRARLAAARRPVPRRPLGLRLHDPAPGRRAAIAPRRRAVRRRRAQEHRHRRRAAPASASSSPRSTPSRPRATRRRWRSPTSRSRPCRCRRSRRSSRPSRSARRASTRRSNRAHEFGVAAGCRRRRVRPHGADADRSGGQPPTALPARSMSPASPPRQRGGLSRPRAASDVRAGTGMAQVLIDFTRPEGTLAHLAVCRELGVNAVIGTTGFSDGAEGRDRRARAAHRDRDGAQHERRRERRVEAARHGGARAERGLRHRDHRGAPPPQGRRAQRHRAEDGRGGRRGARPRPEGLRGLRHAKA